MPRYTVRVELVQKPTSKEEANSEDYVEVRDALALAGFLHTVTNEKGILYELPPAEYRGASGKPVSEVADQVRGIVDPIWTPNRVLVTQGSSYWYGLEKVKATPAKG